MDALTAAATRSGVDIEDPHTWPRDVEVNKEALAELETSAGALLSSNMALLRRDPNERSKMTAGQRFEKRLEYRKKEMHAMLNYIQLRDGAVEKESDVVFFCVDVEAIEVSPGPVSEIGIAILDMQCIGEQSPGNRGTDWWPLMEAHHLRIKEYQGLKNYRYVQGCPDDFQFGYVCRLTCRKPLFPSANMVYSESTFPPGNEAGEAVRAILRPYLGAKRPIVLVGHDIAQDVDYMSSIGFDLKHETQCVGTVDSQSLYRVWMQTDNGRSLSTVLDELRFQYSYLHNAGNDAVHTLRAAIGVAFAFAESASPP